MIKFKLLFCVFFLFAFQMSFSSPQNADVIELIVGCQMENQLPFEKSSLKQDIAGEIPRTKMEVLDYSYPTKCLFLYYHSKDIQLSIIENYISHHAVMQEQLFAACIHKVSMNVPIYLQTERFRL